MVREAGRLSLGLGSTGLVKTYCLALAGHTDGLIRVGGARTP